MIDALRREETATADERRRRDLDARLAVAVLVGPPDDRETVAFGAVVAVHDANGSTYSYTIVGDDDFDLATGRIGESSPLARALVGSRPGATVLWERPIGNKRLVVDSVSYAEHESRPA